MAQSKFIALEVENGVVRRVEGNLDPDKGFWEDIFGSGTNLFGERVNDALNKCGDLGYEYMTTETDGKKTIYRLRLASR